VLSESISPLAVGDRNLLMIRCLPVRGKDPGPAIGGGAYGRVPAKHWPLGCERGTSRRARSCPERAECRLWRSGLRPQTSSLHVRHCAFTDDGTSLRDPVRVGSHRFARPCFHDICDGTPLVAAYSLTARCALTGRSAVNERNGERGGQKDARNGGTDRERPEIALSGRPARSGCSRKPLPILAIKRATPGALLPGVSRELVGRQTRDRSLISPTASRT